MLPSILMPTWFHFASQNRTKIHQNVDPKRLPIMHPFSLRFWTQKPPSWDPTWSHLGPQFRIKTAQEASQTPPQEASQTELGASLVFKVATRRPRRPPSPPLGAFWARFWGVGARFSRFLAPIFLHFFFFWIAFFQQP